MLQTTLEMDKVATVLKLLGEPTRLTTMKLIEHQACCVCELVEIFQVSQPAISQHLRKLKDAGLIQEERRGQWKFYSLNEESEHYDFIKMILKQLPSQEDKWDELKEKGIRMSCC